MSAYLVSPPYQMKDQFTPGTGLGYVPRVILLLYRPASGAGRSCVRNPGNDAVRPAAERHRVAQNFSDTC